MAVDIADPHLRILKCTACAAPVSATPEATLFIATCAACGAENRRELRAVDTTAMTFGLGYRSAAPATQLPPDVPFTRPTGTPRVFSAKKWRSLIPVTRKALATANDAERAVLTPHLFWFQMTLTGGTSSEARSFTPARRSSPRTRITICRSTAASSSPGSRASRRWQAAMRSRPPGSHGCHRSSSPSSPRRCGSPV